MIHNKFLNDIFKLLRRTAYLDSISAIEYYLSVYIAKYKYNRITVNWHRVQRPDICRLNHKGLTQKRI